MAFRDLVPWGRQEDRLPAERTRGDHPLLSLQREVDRLFDDVLRGFDLPSFGGSDRRLACPNLELGETDKEVRVTAELPGLTEKDVEITVTDGVLTLKGEKKSEVDDAERGYSERSYGRFERRISLPRGVEQDEASATFQNAILTVTLPKSEAANENVRRTPINAKAA